jgi:AcrR family transcriptional regulator
MKGEGMSASEGAESTTQPTASPRAYRARRGDGKLLRGEILAAASELLALTRSSNDVSMRAIANRVGVSTPAIYRHFKDKEDLMQAVGAEALVDLTSMMRESAQESPTQADPLLACGLAYVAFAAQRPEHYRLALKCQPQSEPRDPDDGRGTAILSVIQPHIHDYLAARSIPTSDLESLAVALFATAHGTALLVTNTPQLGWEAVPDLVERTLCTVVNGFCDTGSSPLHDL